LELNSAPEKAKYAAWRAKAGTSAASAMRSYLQESERQVRVYGMAAPTSPAAAQLENHASGGTNHRSTAGSSQQPTTHSRGLAAIPLLCAAASEQRVAYLRRLQTTPTAWWRRQEPLTATPGTVQALPETLLLWVAATLERLALACNGRSGSSGDGNNKGTSEPLQALGAVVQSGLWPLHNALLAVWMALILLGTLGNAVTDLAQTVLLGSRRTGRTLASIWADDVVFGSQSVHTLTEAHQPLAARVVGLVLQPYPLAVSLAEMVQGGNNNGNYLWMSCVFGLTVAFTGWYWLVALPWFLVVPVLGSALLLGNCFALIELAAHI